MLPGIDALWTAPKAREYRHQGERGRKLAYKLESLHIIMTTAEELHANTGRCADISNL